MKREEHREEHRETTEKDVQRFAVSYKRKNLA
jgi:hypothetical protein